MIMATSYSLLRRRSFKHNSLVASLSKSQWIRSLPSPFGRSPVRESSTEYSSGALISAIACAERAISLSTALPAIQAEAYVVLADLQAQRGHLPLAGDAAERAIALASRANPGRLAWAYMVKGKALYLGKEFEEAVETHDICSLTNHGGICGV